MKKFIIIGAFFGLLVVPLSIFGLGFLIAEILFVPFILIPKFILSLFVDISSGGSFLMLYLVLISILLYSFSGYLLWLLFKKTNKWPVIAVVVLYYLVVAVFGISVTKTSISYNNIPQNGEITTFEECVMAGNPVMESYPRQCRSENGLFIENIDNDKFEKEIKCDGPDDVCVKEITCKDGFVTEDVEVCGKIQVQCITTPCDPVDETFENRCVARERGAMDIRVGNCEYWKENNKFTQTEGPITYSIEYPKTWFLHDREKNIIFTQNEEFEPPGGTEGYAIGPQIIINSYNFTDSNVESYIEWMDLYGMTDKSELFVSSSDENINGYQMKRVVSNAAGAGGQDLRYVFFVDIQRILVFSQYPYDSETEVTKDFEKIIRTFKIEDTQVEYMSSEELLQKTCSTSVDCSVPFEFAIQSNCPYSGACVEGKCGVVCPMWEHSQNPNESISYNVKCTKDIDCDCSSWDRENRYKCKCVDGMCASLVLY
jgi:hypothetical protein